MSQYIAFGEPIPPIPSADEGDFCVTFDRKYLPYIIGALQALLDSSTYENGDSDSIAMAHDLIATIQTGECSVSVPVGTICNYVTASVPTGYLDCDGSSYLRVDYPDLYAELHASYKTDADHFVTPDFRGRTPIGIGTGSGLSARTMNQAVGAESVALSPSEMPAHSHATPMRNTSVGAGTIAARSSSSSQETTVSTDSKGSGSAHNNMQPSRAVGFCIRAIP